MQDNITQITNALKPLASKLDQGAKIEWSAYYRQTYIDAWTTIIFFGIVLIGLVIVMVVLVRLCNSNLIRIKSDYIIGKILTYIFGSILTLGVLGIILVNGVQPLLNPVYVTTQTIISQVAGNNN